MLSADEKDKIKEGVFRIRQEVPHATEDQMYKMFVMVMNRNGYPLNWDEQQEARQLIADNVREFNKTLN